MITNTWDLTLLNPSLITPEDMRRLCQAPDAATLVGVRDRALLATLASSGLRASELTNLTLEQMMKRGKGYVLQVIGKTDIEPRDAHISIEAHEKIFGRLNLPLDTKVSR